jgi:hypothetical protein
MSHAFNLRERRQKKIPDHFSVTQTIGKELKADLTPFTDPLYLVAS